MLAEELVNGDMDRVKSYTPKLRRNDMRILDEQTDKPLSKITLFLTRSEAAELRDSLVAILEEGDAERHEHISSQDYLKEVTVCLYDTTSLENFDERSKKLIKDDA